MRPSLTLRVRILLCISPFLIWCCGRREQSLFPPSREQSLFPLSADRQWTYETNMGTNLTVTNFPLRKLSSMEVVPRRFEWNPGNSSFSFINESEGCIGQVAAQLAGDQEPRLFDPPRCLLRAPIQIGKVWQTEANSIFMSPGKQLALNITVESVADTITVPAGTFSNCVKTAAKGSVPSDGEVIIAESFDWYCPEVGWVKQVWSEASLTSSEKKEFILQLAEYHDKAP